MTIPFELANLADTKIFDPNTVVFGRSYYYSDASPNFKDNAISDGLIQYDSDAVAGQIEIVIGTPVGSEPFEPTFGSNALDFVFENANQAQKSALELEILNSLREWLGDRLDFFSVTVTSDDKHVDTYVAIPFRIKTSNVEKVYVGNLSNLKTSRG